MVSSERVASSDGAGDLAPSPGGESDVAVEEDYGNWPVVDDSAPVDGVPSAAAQDESYVVGASIGTEPGAGAEDEPYRPGQGVEQQEEQADDIGLQDREEQVARVYSQEEVSKMNSSWDQRIAGLERQLQEERAARQRVQQSAGSTASGARDVEQQAQRDAIGMRDELARQLVAQGFTETEAVEQANGQVGAYYRAWEASREAASQKAESAALKRQAQLEAWNNQRLNIAAEYGVPPDDLLEFATPRQMEKYARAVSRGRPPRRPQRAATGGGIPADTAPLDNERLLDLYNEGLIDEDDPLMKRVNAVLDRK